MTEKITAKVLKKEKEKVERLMSVFGTTYNEWLHEQHEKYIHDNNERALEELLKMREKFSSDEPEVKEATSKEAEPVQEKATTSTSNFNL
ncbi:MAG: hypothetical protein ACQEWW_26315 [Bacillota bacterium]